MIKETQKFPICTNMLCSNQVLLKDQLDKDNNGIRDILVCASCGMDIE